MPRLFRTLQGIADAANATQRTTEHSAESIRAEHGIANDPAVIAFIQYDDGSLDPVYDGVSIVGNADAVAVAESGDPVDSFTDDEERWAVDYYSVRVAEDADADETAETDNISAIVESDDSADTVRFFRCPGEAEILFEEIAEGGAS
jgi:hypothetical protein